MNQDELLSLWSSLHQLNTKDKSNRQKWEEISIEVDMVLAEAKNVTNFRKFYEKWIKRRQGQSVKKELLTIQAGMCYHCGGSLFQNKQDGSLIDHSEIHHLAPLAILQKYADANPDLALEELRRFVTTPKYLRLVHPTCNKKLGETIGDLPELSFLRQFLQ